MPKTSVQRIVFGVLMSITMAYGMEVYNVALREGGLSAMTDLVFWDALKETAYMWLFVFLFSTCGETAWAAPWPPGSAARRTRPFSAACSSPAAPYSSCARP